jgi:hypothetical protein
MNSKEAISTHNIWWCAEDGMFYVDEVPLIESSFSRYAKFVWNIGFEDMLAAIKNGKRVILKRTDLP